MITLHVYNYIYTPNGPLAHYLYTYTTIKAFKHMIIHMLIHDANCFDIVPYIRSSFRSSGLHINTAL